MRIKKFKCANRIELGALIILICLAQNVLIEGGRNELLDVEPFFQGEALERGEGLGVKVEGDLLHTATELIGGIPQGL